MALYLPIRAFNRSQNVRIGGQKISPTATSYVDISVATTRKEFTFHSAIGAVYPVGSLSASNTNPVVWDGILFTAGAGLTNSTTSAGDLKDRTTGVMLAVAAATGVTFGANGSGNPRIDLVVADNTTGAITVVAGTAAASPVAPATPAGKTALYQVTIVNAATAPGTTVDVRPRP